MSVNLLLISSLISIGIFSTTLAYADGFDQNPIAIEHSSVITIEDPNAIGQQFINANLTSGAENIEIELYETDPGVFKSVFVEFTSGTSDDGNAPKLHVIDGSIVNLLYNGATIDSTVITSTTLTDPPSEYSGYAKTFRTINARGCPSSYGGDVDRDGICDNWERSPYKINYPSSSDYTLPCVSGVTYATDPLGTQVCPTTDKKDIYVEIDYVKGHKPDIEAIKDVVESFSAANFQLHVFIDDEPFSEHIDKIRFPGSSGAPGFDQIKAKEFGISNEKSNPKWPDYNWIAKSQVFYYYIWTHSQSDYPTASGVSEEGGNDGGVTLGVFDGKVGSTDQQAGTFMHELGHNLGIDHGGDINNEDNCKPNLMSVMSYSRQFSDLVPNRSLDYARSGVGTGVPPSLGNETNLAGQPIIVGPYEFQNDAMMVFGISNGQTMLVSLPADASTGMSWPANWQDIRYIKDSKGNVVCDAPTTPAILDSVDQWSLIDLYQKNSHWREGRSGGNSN